MMPVTGIQGQTLEVTVVGCNRLKDTEWFSRQDPYVSVEYGSTKFLSCICTDGDRNPTYQDKFLFTLIEGLRELSVTVWNSNTFAYDNLIGSGKVQLQKVLSKGFDDTPWTILSKSGRYAGEVRLIMHYSNANKPNTGCAPSAPQYHAAPPPPPPQVPLYYAPPPAAPSYPAYPSVHPPQPFPPQPYPPQPAAAHPPHPAAAHPPQPSMYPKPYPPQTYPPQTYPPQSTCCYPPNPYQTYPPPY